ncbi:MAG: hypothetical protein GF383_09500 [Candidatus Lokiarchaeota archaeon]|nr:hypothetical protein [Candidatus Lokiarchaeota archaeon]MBD3340748.1 hypothetical protein [Candidatus Lokiarchaeota archaeon]
MEIINYLGERLAEKINISSPAGRGLLKLSIKDELGPFKELNQIRYKELENIINNSLKERLIGLGISDHGEVLKYLLEELNANQSLITIGGVSL